MNERLHPLTLGPLTLGEILDRTAQMYRTRFLRYVGIAALPTVVMLAVLAAAVGFAAAIRFLGGSGRVTGGEEAALVVLIVVLGLVALPVMLGAMALSWGALTDAAARTFLGGTFTIREAYASVWKRRWRLLWLMTMEVLFVGVLPGLLGVVALVLNAALAGKGATAALGILAATATFVLMAVMAGAMLWLLLRLCLGFAACVVEQVSAWQALKRSSVLGKATRGRMFVLFLLGYALDAGLSIAIFLLLVIAMAFVPGLRGARNADLESTVVIFGFYGLSFAVHMLVRPVYGIGLTLFYFDQRIRKEGFDIEWMMRDAGMVNAAAVETPAMQAEASPWLTLPEEPAEGTES
ncbi:MAG TPA: hypothetical protein VFU55_01955 [Terracidiphilus sp.]|nr:hypothetical protein [Terracidiphilus sp.]